MAVHHYLDVQPRIDRILRGLRHIHGDVLPRAEHKIECSLESVSESIGRALESTQKLLDPDD